MCKSEELKGRSVSPTPPPTITRDDGLGVRESS